MVHLIKNIGCIKKNLYCNTLKVPKSQTNNGKGESLLWPVWGMLLSIE